MREKIGFIFALIFGVIAAAMVWFLVEIGRRFLDALDALGDLAFTIPVIIAVVCFCALIVAGTWHLVEVLKAKRRRVHADRHTALYPQIRVDPRRQDREAWLDLNAVNAQVAAALPRVKTNAQVVDRLTRPAQLAGPEYPPMPQIAAPAPPDVFRPQSVYDAPISREIAVPVGVDGQGRPVSIPIEGHSALLVGGLPGSGKTEFVGSVVAGLMRQDPTGKRVQFTVLDPKMADFASVRDDLTGLWRPVARDVEPGIELMQAVQAECRRRFQVLQENGAVNLPDLAEKGVQLPYLVCVVDEWASFSDSREFSEASLYVARMGRAAGILAIFATQRPSARVVNPDVRACASATVAFRCRSKGDSVVLLDDPAAADLPAVPGRAIVAMGDHTHVHTYQAGIRGGRFGQFMASLPRVDGSQPLQPASNWQPVGLESVEMPARGFQPPSQAQIPTIDALRKIARGRAPTEQEKALMRFFSTQGGRSMTDLCFMFWGYKDDVVLDFVRDALGRVKGQS